MSRTLEELMKQSNISNRDNFLDSLNDQLRDDNHDISLDERLEIISTCFDKNINSVIM